MNKSEQIARLKDIRNVIEDTISKLKEEEVSIQRVIEKADLLDDDLLDIGYQDAFDMNGFRERLFNELFDNAMGEAYDMTNEFLDDVNDVIGRTASDIESEELEERYENFNHTVVQKFYYPEMNYHSIEHALEHVEKVLDVVNKLHFELL